MVQFVLAGLLATIFAYLSYYYKKDSYLVFSMVILWYIAAFQDCIASDFIAYKRLFESIKYETFDYSPALFLTNRMDQIEIGWFLLNKVISYVSPSFYIVSALVYSFVLSVFYRLIKRAPSKWRWVGVFYLYFTPGWFTSIMSAERQAVAISFWILMVFAILDRAYLKAVLLALLGISFHNSFIFALSFLLLLLIPFERINFQKNKVLKFSSLVLLFVLGMTYIQSITNELSLFFMGLDNNLTDVYDNYLLELSQKNYSQKITTILIRLVFFVMVLVALFYRGERLPDSNMFLVLFVFSYLFMTAFGSAGNLARIFRYTLFLSLPALPFAITQLKKEMRIAFISFTILLSFYSLFSAFGTEQFEAYRHYHTIFF